MIPKLPDEYKGQHTKNGGYTSTTPRQWTDEELKWIVDLKNKGFSNAEIAESVERSIVSVQIKLKRMSKKSNEYNKPHVQEKYNINNKFLNEIKPKSVLDLYAGEKNFYKNYEVTTNDKNPSVAADYHEDAHKLICELYHENRTYDLIDLDPFGSAYDCFDLAIKMAKKGLVITLGELGHKRWKRLDYVGTHYDIENLDDFTIENLIKHIQKIGLRNKKKLTVFDYKEWRNIGRVWFKVDTIKVTMQWEQKEVSQ